MKKYYIKTFGCQMNVYDSQRIAAILKSLGYAEASSLKNADLVILNTCHIREKAAEKVFSDLGRIELVRQERAAEGLDTVIGVVGCVVQAEDDQIAKRAPYVDFAAGPLTYHRLPEILAKVGRRRGHTVIDTEFPVESKFDFLPDNQSAGGCSYLAIQEGCNNFCTYCVVPYTRGVETSRPVEDIIREAKRLVEGGTVEINLLGQNVNSYHGEDSAGKERNLAHLLRRLNEIEGLQRIRYTTSYPADVDDDLIACHRDLPKLMPYRAPARSKPGIGLLFRFHCRISRRNRCRLSGNSGCRKPRQIYSGVFIQIFPPRRNAGCPDAKPGGRKNQKRTLGHSPRLAIFISVKV